MKKFAKVLFHDFRLLFIILSILWMELLLKYYCFGMVFDVGIIYVTLFTVPIACLLCVLSSLFSEKTNKAVFSIIIFSLGIFYMAQFVYYTVFKAFLMPDKLNMADDVMSSFLGEAIDAFITVIPYTLLIFLPFVFLVVHFFGVVERSGQTSEFFGMINFKLLFFYIVIFVITQVLAVSLVYISNYGIISPKAIYTDAFSPELSMRNFGNITTVRLSVNQLLLENEVEEASNDASLGASSEPEENTLPQEEVEANDHDANILSIDFETLAELENDAEIKDMHVYFSVQEPTLQNEYTGMFEGKNLIFITAEGLWQYAVNEQYTPNLYKLTNEGFVFENFYNPLWWNSTNDGEFVATNGLYPLNYTRAFYESYDNLLPFTMGNILSEEGYETTAYHNHYYNYYDRDLTHPNMGYDYYGLGNGLEVSETWPESDLEMMELTIAPALESGEPFHLYYMTISGHMYYTFEGNSMAAKNRDAVESLDMSEEAKAYIACHIELDNAIGYILDELKAAGELENTVICMSSDHYPYGLSEETLTEFHGSMPDEFELHRSPLIIWSGDMEEPIYIDKVSSSVDILPTLLNLFGAEYDSRLLSGKDILSDTPGIALFSNQSFITDEGRYSSVDDRWYPNDDSNTDYSYAAEIFDQLQQTIDYNEKIIMTDYYRYLFDDESWE